MCPGVALTQKHSPNTCLKGEKGLCLREAPRAPHNNRQTSRHVVLYPPVGSRRQFCCGEVV